jgi:hypothetical protein
MIVMQRTITQNECIRLATWYYLYYYGLLTSTIPTGM